MLSLEKFQQWSQKQKWSQTTSQVVADIRASPPSRRIRSRSGNVSGRYPSRKMGVTIQFESHKVELAGIYQMEYDSDVLEYYDQPPSIKLNYKSLNGRNVGVWHTPDFFVIRHKEAGWEEWKTVKQLSQLAVKMPHRYIKDDLNQWRCPPGEFYAESLGLYYRLRTDAEINWTLQNNLQFLEDYFRGTSVVVEAEQESLINSLIIKQPGITLAELVNKGCSPDSIYTLLANQKLEMNLQSANLVQNPELVRVFLKGQKKTVKEQSKREPHNVWFVPYVGQKLVWNGRTLEVINPGQTQTALTTDEDKVIQIPHQELSDLVKSGAIQVITANDTETEKIKGILDSASARDCTEANRRYQIIADYLSGENMTGILHGLFGTYELLEFRNLSGQLSRRSIDIHFSRYHANSAEDLVDFQRVLHMLWRKNDFR